MGTFKFQEFSLAHGSSSMKVGTDGILLGAWADCLERQNILDVGTGCGLIALMLAQRTVASESKISAIDIEHAAFEQAAKNFANSRWSHRLAADHAPFYEFALLSQQKNETYDLIVCNPPYFDSGIPPNNSTRRNARHSLELSRESLFKTAASIMPDTGVLALILPFEQLENALKTAAENELGLFRQTCVRPLTKRPFKRVLLEFGFNPVKPVFAELTIETVHHVYTDEFRQLTGRFYLRFDDENTSD